MPCRTDRSFSSSGLRDGQIVAPNAAERCNSIDRPREQGRAGGKWIPNGGRHCERRGKTISLVMETACRGNRQYNRGKEDTFTKAKRAGRVGGREREETRGEGDID